MDKMSFTKMVASGNDFVVIDSSCQLPVASCQSLTKKICDRKFGIGADGALLLAKSKKADIKMRIFNADGSEAEMCGNGARCAALWMNSKLKTQNSKLLKIETKAGIIESVVEADNVKIKLTDPKDIKTDIPLRVKRLEKSLHSPPFDKGGKRGDFQIKVNFINTGVPHTVIFVEGLEKIDVFNLGRNIRYHNKFKPSGTNVDFVEIINKDSISVRTYERGVEDETLACGTGAIASALIYAIHYKLSVAAGFSPRFTTQAKACDYLEFSSFADGLRKMNVYTKGGEILKVYFDKIDDRFYNIWLEGRAKIVYEGEYYV